MHIKDLTVDELKTLIRETVEDTLQDLLLDPDTDRPVKQAFEQQLIALRERRQTGQTQALSSDEAMRALGLR
ncbi:hypothetical protein C7293_09750 [filamentous cyanobacterium CCT1]|nr:hypothetical protein C7293_09750 [filamentous cyanobacterium CCT1]PSN81214.1 hypothetical protein C8B47_02370 [filamentous cyanobacterium CCP4]